MFCSHVDNNPGAPLFGRIRQSFRVKMALHQHVAVINILLKEPEIRNVSEVVWYGGYLFYHHQYSRGHYHNFSYHRHL